MEMRDHPHALRVKSSRYSLERKLVGSKTGLHVMEKREISAPAGNLISVVQRAA
jgi:hypothetical protein